MLVIFLITNGSFWGDLLSFAMYIFIIWMLVHIVQKIRSIVPEAHSNWHHSFENIQFSSQQFYSAVEEAIKQREIPSVTVSKVTYKEGGLLSGSRVYLRVSRDRLVFDVCAAPFGNGFFVSWWQGEMLQLRRRIIASIPGIGKRLENILYTKTYFEADTEAIFKSGVHACVLSAIETLTSPHGIRQLSEFERRAFDISMKK